MSIHISSGTRAFIAREIQPSSHARATSSGSATRQQEDFQNILEETRVRRGPVAIARSASEGAANEISGSFRRGTSTRSVTLLDTPAWETGGSSDASESPSARVFTKSTPEVSETAERFMLPMQSSWTAPDPATLASQSTYPMDPVHGVPTVSEETLNRYFHPLQSVGVIYADGASGIGASGGIGTTVYRVSPDGGIQDFVTSDGFRHRFDVEVTYPAALEGTWQGRTALEIHPEVATFAEDRMLESLEQAGLPIAGVEVSAFRMHGGTPATPWFLDQLAVTSADGRTMNVSLNVAMRDPQNAVDAVAGFLTSIPT